MCSEGEAQEEELQACLVRFLLVLRGTRVLWHRTSLQAFRGIIKSGAIEPNLGQFPYTYPQSKASFGRSIGAISLFDFDKASVDEIMRYSDAWAAFFVDQGAATIVIQIDPRKLDASLFQDANSADSSNRIPFVEAWYRGKIPTSAFAGFLMVKGAHGIEDGAFDLIPMSDHAVCDVDNLASKLISAEVRDRECRLASGNLNLEDLVLASQVERTDDV